ncbi:MAG: formate dehydrogenase [Desulfotignum sp.]|nr:formate dehydrogenase [Desulfotignum sp.]MCF8125374.1 formate dehydrogenase [Desulfotignum sp.]
MSKSILIDTTLCTACRGCQVACKQWHDLPAEKTVNTGSFQNPPDLTHSTYKLVRMTEAVVANRLQWLFFPDQCRHCLDAPCLDMAVDPRAIYRDDMTGAVLYTQNTRLLDAEEINVSCPYDIPRSGSDGTIAKCDFCNDRIRNGLTPACVAACSTGAMQFGDREDILDKAEKRLSRVRKKYPDARLLDPEDVNVIYMVAFDPHLYADYAVAATGHGEITRSVALRKMVAPLARMMGI